MAYPSTFERAGSTLLAAARSAVGSVTVLLALGLGAPAQAAVTSYTDDTAFAAAAGSVVVHDFDAFVRTDGPDIFGVYLPLDQQIPGIDFDNARVNLGAFGGTSRSAPNVVLNADFVNPIVITFATPQRAVGLYNTSLVDAERFDIYDASDTLLGSINLGAQVVNFGGFISDTGILRVRVTPIAPTNGSIYIDDLTVPAVPEPGAGWLLAGGLLLIWHRWRRGHFVSG